MESYALEIIFLILAFVPAIVCHEVAHGLAAYWLGDDTAKAHGRLTLNPLAHFSLMGTLAIFLVHVGWAKPVPINPRNFSKPRRDLALCSLAGPMANLTLALISGLIISIIIRFPVNELTVLLALFFSQYFLLANIILFIFNLIPIPPLDGAGILEYILPQSLRAGWHEFGKNGPLIIIIIVGIQYFFHIPIFGYILQRPAEMIGQFVLFISGVS